MIREDIIKLLSGVQHPESNSDIVSTEIAKSLKVEDFNISLTLEFRPNDPFAVSIKKRVEELIKVSFPEYSLKILELFKETKPVKKQENENLVGLEQVKNIIAVASGKGGVGKSTISSNIAVCLAQMGYKVGLIDADVYGPSIPKMFGVEDAKPVMIEENGFELIEPAEKYGVKLMSIGFFVDPSEAVAWRGPVVISALRQLSKQVAWGELDFIIIDLPPGTGDIHLTLAQELKPTAAVVVTTPQDVALADVVKGISLFRNENIKIPIAGLIENMSWFTPEELPENKYYIFGKDGGVKMAESLNIPLLGQIPLVQSIRESGDSGEPIVISDNISAEAFKKAVKNLLNEIQKTK